MGITAALGLTVAAAAAGAGTASAENAAAGCAQSGPFVTCGYTVTPDEQSLVVPAGVTKMRVTAIGGAGGSSQYTGAGGLGGKVAADVPVTPGQTLYIRIGVDGGDGTNKGGGFSSVSTKSIKTDPVGAMNSRILVAPGGGAASSAGAGGNAGESAAGVKGGKVGTDAAGGAGGVDSNPGQPGVLGIGGAAFGTGGGGGGGYYGGGGGAAGGSGGGGSFLVPAGGEKGLAKAGTAPVVGFTFTLGAGLIPGLGDGCGSFCDSFGSSGS
uniref:hypothetical protein n=1 Tax=Rhodococcus oryzae TaxID=2571143 RepID=UPI00145D2077|nr:hypothetical protein [Rhodococcus oryzae]